jgi:hypothetical protein
VLKERDPRQDLDRGAVAAQVQDPGRDGGGAAHWHAPIGAFGKQRGA